MLRKLNNTQSTAFHLSVRAASDIMYLPCVLANSIVSLAARLCCATKLGVGGPPNPEDLSRSLASYQSSLATVSAGGKLVSCRPEKLAMFHGVSSLRSESSWAYWSRLSALGIRSTESQYTALGKPYAIGP